MTAPVAKKIPTSLEKHGDKREDPYFWIREKENPEVISYIEEENAYKEAQMSHLKGFQDKLYEEIIGRLKKDDSSVPYKRGEFYYYSRYREGGEYPIYCRKKGSLENEEQVILDVNKLAEGKSFCQVGGFSMSPNGRYLAYGLDTVGRRIYTTMIKDLDTGETLPESIDNGTANFTWAADSKHLFYSVKDTQTLRHYAVKRHELHSNPSEDVLVYEDKDETFYVYVYKSNSEKYLFISSSATMSSETHYLPSDNAKGNFELIIARELQHEYSVEHHGEYFYVLSNDQAVNFRVMRIPVGKTGKEHWEEFIAHREDVFLEDMDTFKGHYVLSERKEGLNLIRVVDWEGKKDFYIEFNDPTYSAYIATNVEFETNTLRYGYNSLTTPASTLELNIASRESKLLKQAPVMGSFSPDDYQSARVFAKAEDGTLIPMSVVWKKTTALDGKAPLLLYAYGSYGISVDPYFSSARLSLLDRGFVFAIAHIRGGSEMGRPWYDDGKLLKKKNTFTDFIACGKHLIKEGYAGEDKLFAMGGSAGGLLMGAVINMAPELFEGVVAAVPFVDVVSTMLDESIPLTTNEYNEWGNPNDEEYYHYIKSYSPYDNVEAKAYPHMLVTSGLHDSQVQYWEPTKWVAKLRDVKTDNNKLLLHTNMEAGHGGASGRYEAYKETAMEYTFFLDLAGRLD
ncbi:MAG: S9 family peptidase [Bacteroidia bacterium]|nr:S9 family peptidase [Bacteroidia bacterium]